MNELQGLNYIDDKGYFKGIIEQINFDDQIQKYIIGFRTPNSGYHVTYINPNIFNLFEASTQIRSERYNIIRNKHISNIYHFSPIENTASILEYGILSREYVNALDIPATTPDPYRYDGELGKICASISFPNYKMKYKLEREQNMQFVIYDINPRILLSKLDTQFYYTNAANNIFNSVDKVSLTTNQAFLNMFKLENRDPYIPDNYTTDPQAEVLINNCIENDYIEKVIVKNNNEEIKNLCEGKQLVYTINSGLHSYRQDYGRW